MSDTQAREPLLSDDAMRGRNGDQLMDPEQVRDFYEAKITSGELGVVKTVKWTWNGLQYLCECGSFHDKQPGKVVNFCRVCGAQIEQ